MPDLNQVEQISKELRVKLEEAVKRSNPEALLFSGGLDTGILAFLLPETPSLSVRLEDWGGDFAHARKLSQQLRLDLHLRKVNLEEALEAIPEVIKIRKSFDPALPNDLALYFGLKFAAENGFRKAATGDGSDELFAGYSYMFDLDLKQYLPKLAERMEFSSSEIGSHLGIEMKRPFLDKEFVNFALSIDPALKVRKENGKRHGKWILRKAFEPFLPEEIIWQNKRPIEVGTGFSRLREIIESKVGRIPENVGVKFLSKEHFYYWQVYREVVGKIPPPGAGEEKCPGCGGGIKNSSFHCRVCGWSKRL